MTQTTVSRPRKVAAPDPICLAAVDLARARLLDLAPAEHVGEHVSGTADQDRMVTHRFTCMAPGYFGWLWAVTVVRAPRAKSASIAELILEPGAEALLAPPWVPWSQRVAPGDLGVGDVLPASEDDLRLAPGWSGLDDLAAAADEPSLRLSGWELGSGRLRVLSAIGRDDATARWRSGDTGPQTPMARSAPGMCTTCGFLLPIGGPMGSAFGLCANGMSPADGRVVCLDFGCGAHSEAGSQRPRG